MVGEKAEMSADEWAAKKVALKAAEWADEKVE